MAISYHGSTYIFRDMDVHGKTEEEIISLAEKSGRIQYEPSFVWLVVPGIGYGMREENRTF